MSLIEFNANKEKILYVSNNAPAKPHELYDAFKRITDTDILYKEDVYKTSYSRKFNFLRNAFSKIGLPLDKGLNKKILNKVISGAYDIVLIHKGNDIYPSTLSKIKRLYPALKLVNWSFDDMMARHNRSLYYTHGLKLYDLVVTVKSFNCNPEELPSLGAKNILLLNQIYCRYTHNPCENCERISDKFDVVFIGYAERERFECMNFLAENGIKLHVFGTGWNKKTYQKHNKNLHIHFRELLKKDYANTISCSKISLCFLRKINRDVITKRSVEIPACRGFMVAERTNEHLKFFREDKEAVFFASKEELLEKVRYYLEHEEERKKIAQAGYEKCLRMNCTYDDMARAILAKIVYPDGCVEKSPRPILNEVPG